MKDTIFRTFLKSYEFAVFMLIQGNTRGTFAHLTQFNFRPFGPSSNR